MRLASIDNLPATASLARDVYVGAGPPLLRSGVNLTERLVEALRDHGLSQLWIEDRLSRGIEPVREVISQQTRSDAELTRRDLIAAVEKLVKNGTPIPTKVTREVSRTAVQLAVEIAAAGPKAIYPTEIVGSDGYTETHGVRVASLGLMIAARSWQQSGWTDWSGRKRDDRVEMRLARFGIGLMLLDVGKLAIAPEILNKPGKLTPEEFEVVKTHTKLGVKLLEASDMDAVTLSVIRSHHERWDGTGYPEGYSGTTISEFARYASVADVYDALCSDRPHKKAQPPAVGLRIVSEGSGTAFDPNVVATFRTVVLPYPPAHTIELPGGREAVVAEVDVDDPYRPTVRFVENGDIVERVVDLARAELRLVG